ncbi:hypothetical protein V1517DRAFT_366526 [Lipomyces orientalis]|uniref:Uncharacterized protein n=1 Tax=Lipomyces orientalis TaxID=1233043 RepID=A0ACC3TRS1_9ASCO
MATSLRRCIALRRCTRTSLAYVVRRPLSPDCRIEVAASRDEYEYVQEILEEKNVEYSPILQFDGWRNVAIIVAAPSPLHGHMVGHLMTRINDAVNSMQALDSNIKDCLSMSLPVSNTAYAGRTCITRNWDSALLYVTDEGFILMVAVEVGISQIYEGPRAAISYSVCALHCRVGITVDAAIQQAERQLRTALRNNPYGPLIADGFIWYGWISRAVVETLRYPEDTCPPDTLLESRQSFAIVDAGQFVGGNVPSNLAELRLADCIPTHILIGNTIAATPVHFFSQEWFARSFGHAMLENALQRIKRRSEARAD